MPPVTIRHRPDGIVELSPRLARLDAEERVLVVATVLLVSLGLYVAALLPPGVFVAVAASALAGELARGVKAAVLVLSRPPARVVEVPVRPFPPHRTP